MGPVSHMPQRLRLRWHLPAAVFFIVAAVSFASLRIARTAILSSIPSGAGIASPYLTQTLPVDPIGAARQTLLESLAADNRRFDALNQQRNSLSPNPPAKTSTPSTPKPGPTLGDVRAQLASALANLINLEKSPYASGSEILTVRKKITLLQQRMAALEAHKALPQTTSPAASTQPPTQLALLDEQISQTQLQTITDLQSLARLPQDHPAAQPIQPLPSPHPSSATYPIANQQLIQRAAIFLQHLHLSQSQQAAIVSISAVYAFALSISLGFIFSLFTLLVSEGFRASA